VKELGARMIYGILTKSFPLLHSVKKAVQICRKRIKHIKKQVHNEK